MNLLVEKYGPIVLQRSTGALRPSLPRGEAFEEAG